MWRGQGGCERRIEVFVKIQKKNIFFWGGRGGGVGFGGVRVDVIEELKFLGKFTKKKIGRGGGSGRGGGGGGGGVGWWGGLDGCERRIEFFCENSKKKNWGGGSGEGGRVGRVRVNVNREVKFL